MTWRMMTAFAATILLGLTVAACGGGAATATPRATATTQPAATSTPRPATPTAQRTATTPAATATPVPTVTPAPTYTPAPSIKRGGTLKQGVRPTAEKSFQPSLFKPSLGRPQLEMSRLVYQSLFYYDPYNNHEFAGLLADKWQFNETADQITVRINPAAKWSDGKPVTAQDVKFSYDILSTPPQGFTVGAESGANAVPVGKGIAGITIVDDKTLVIKLKAPDVSILALMADPDVVIRPSYRDLTQAVTDPLGSGGYVFKDVQAGVKFTHLKNPNAWMKDGQGGALPYADGVTSFLLVEDRLALSALETGQVDFLNTVWLTAFQGKEAGIKQRNPKITLYITTAGSSGWGFRNVPPFNNPKVQQALSILTDRLAYVELGLNGDGVLDGIGTMPSSSGTPWALPMKELLSTPGFRYVNRKTGELETDMAKLKAGLSTVYQKDPKDIALGKQMLKEAGLDPEAGKFPKITLSADQRFETRATVLAEALRQEIGAEVVVELSDIATQATKMANGQFQAVNFTIHVGAPDPSQTLIRYTSGNGTWKHGYEVKELDDLYAQQSRAVDPAKRKELIYAFQRKLIEAPHIIPAGYSVGTGGGAREWVRNFPPSRYSGSNVFSLDRIWLDQ